MSSLTLAPGAVQDQRRRNPVRPLVKRLGLDALIVVALLEFAVALIVELPGDFNIDSWLALLTGRMVWQSGIPHHETLIAFAYGHHWVDQQWLSQLASYGLYAVGGLALLGLVNIALLVGGIGGAAAAARRLGAPSRAVLLTLPLSVALVSPSREVRTQTFVIPLFVAICYLLACDSRAPSRRVYWSVALLVVWANLHGTVTLAAGLVVLRALTLAWERRAQLGHSARAWRRPVALGVGAPLSILLTPYGLGMVDYYRTTMVGGTLRQAVSEWQPVTSVPVLAAFVLVLAALAIWSFGANPSRTTPWERLTLLVLAVASVAVQRNALFLGLFGLMIVPVSLGAGRAARTVFLDRPASSDQSLPPVRVGVNTALLAISALVLVGAAASVMIRPASRVELHYQRTGVLTAVQKAVRLHPGLRMMADERFDDWLLWRDPALAGRVATDARFELLSPRQVDEIQSLFAVTGLHWKQAAHGYRLLVLDRKHDPDAVAGFMAEPGRQVLYDDGQRVVILRPRAQMGAA